MAREKGEKIPASKKWFSDWPRAEFVQNPRGVISNEPVGIIAKHDLFLGLLLKYVPAAAHVNVKSYRSVIDAFGCAKDTMLTLYIGCGRKVVLCKIKKEHRALHAKRKALADVMRTLSDTGHRAVSLALGDASWVPALDAALAGLYDYDSFKERDLEKDPRKPSLLRVHVAGRANPDLSRLNILMHSNFFVRDLVNRPPEAKPPRKIAKVIGQHLEGLDRNVEISWLAEGDPDFEKMGFLHAVGDGVDDPLARPMVLVAEYKHPRARNKKPIVLVGKGVCFDTGGYSLKPAEGMRTMKLDMAGAATVFGVIRDAALSELPLYIVAVAPFAYNVISPQSYLPDAIPVSHSGKTAEIGNTDAEGRLILADALSYAFKKFKPELTIDVATLTGACVVALGENIAGIFVDTDKMASNNPVLKLFMEAGKKTGEPYWPLPLHEEYFEKEMKSHIANMNNVGGKPAGAITAALFLKQYVGKAPWYHLDIAGPAFNSKTGATGFGVRSIVEVLENYIRSK